MSGSEPPKNSPTEELRTLEFKRLTAECSRGAFSCHDEDIDRFFVREALDHHQKMRCRTVTAHFEGDARPMGFYALTNKIESASVFKREHQNKTYSEKGFVTSVRLGWLAVQYNHQSKGYGEVIMGKVIKDFYDITVMTGVFALTLTALNERAASFYTRLGFVKYGPDSATPSMLLPSESAINLIEQNA